MKLEYAIFDLDGTLLDSMPMWHSIEREYLRSKGINPPADLSEQTKQLSLPQSAEMFRTRYGVSEDVDTIIAEINEMIAAHYRTRIPPKPDVIPFLQALQDRGVKMAVATATDAHALTPALERLNMLRFFSCIVTCTEVGKPKTSPLVYDVAAERLGAPYRSAVIFEDAIHCARTAHAAGFPLVIIEDDAAADDREELMQLADLYVTDYRGLEERFTYPTR